MSVINVNSEIQPLKKVLLHRPGAEFLNLTPETLERLLFDDIPFLRNAQAEHDEFADILRGQGAEVVYLEDLVAETLDANEGLREPFLRQFIEEAGIHTEEYTNLLLDHFMAIEDTKEMVEKTMGGVNFNELEIKRESALVDYLREEGESAMILDPMPNLVFTRDPFSSVGDGAIVNRMYADTRNRETIYCDYVFNHHPEYKGQVQALYGRDNAFHMEGGDILNINEHTLAIGISQRTEPAAIDLLARKLFFEKDTKIDTILAVDIPVCRAMMHLDTVFTQIDTDKFTVHPGILGPLRVFELKKNAAGDDVQVTEIIDELDKILAKYLGLPKVELILCGGGDTIIAEREQWNDGSNTLTVAPGVVVVYERNDITNAILREKGLTVLEMTSGELSRGRGGPRCMSMPLVRED